MHLDWSVVNDRCRRELTGAELRAIDGDVRSACHCDHFVGAHEVRAVVVVFVPFHLYLRPVLGVENFRDMEMTECVAHGSRQPAGHIELKGARHRKLHRVRPGTQGRRDVRKRRRAQRDRPLTDDGGKQ